MFGEELETACESQCGENIRSRAAGMLVGLNASYFFLHKSSHPVEMLSMIERRPADGLMGS